MKKKPVKIPDCGWGSETRKLKGPFKNLKDVTETRYFDKVHHKKAYEDSAPEKTGLKVVTQKPSPKANVIDGKWGMGKWKWQTGTSGLPPNVFQKVPKGHGYFIPVDGVMVQHVLIQKKHLDEAKWAIRLAIGPKDQSKIWTDAHIARMRKALKNISVK